MGLKPTTLYSLDRALNQLSYRGSSVLVNILYIFTYIHCIYILTLWNYIVNVHENECYIIAHNVIRYVCTCIRECKASWSIQRAECSLYKHDVSNNNSISIENVRQAGPYNVQNVPSTNTTSAITIVFPFLITLFGVAANSGLYCKRKMSYYFRYNS